MLSVHVTVSEIDHAQCFLTYVPEGNRLLYWGYISDTHGKTYSGKNGYFEKTIHSTFCMSQFLMANIFNLFQITRAREVSKKPNLMSISNSYCK